MKKLFLFLILISLSVLSFSQESKMTKDHTTDSIQRRIDQLICTKEYNAMLERIERESLVGIGTVIDNNIATYRIGKKRKGKPGYSTMYTIRYAIKEDKLLSVSAAGS